MLVTLSEFKNSRYFKTGWSDSEITYALNYAEERFYVLTQRAQWGYWLEPRELDIQLDGTGTKLIRSTYPVVELLDVRIRSGGGGELTVTNLISFRNHFLYLAGEMTWPSGVMNVRVRAKFGDPRFARQPIPTDVKEAILRMAFLKLRREYRMAGENLQERRAPETPLPPPTITGDREVDAIITAYTIKPPLGIDIRGPYGS